MEKLARKIFQPSVLTNDLIDGMCKLYDCSMNEFINKAIENQMTPVNEELRKETEYIFMKMKGREEISQQEMNGILSRAVASLKNHPIGDKEVLEQIFLHYTNPVMRSYRYDYILIVNSLQDERLHRLNEILKTLDSDFNLGMREFGERSRYMFKNWKELCAYPEIYVMLSTLIECEDTYRELSIYRLLDLLIWMDKAIRESDIVPIKEPFKTDISMDDRYHGLRYELNIYYTDSAYSYLSKDHTFMHMSEDIRNHYKEYMELGTQWGDIRQEDVEKLIDFEKRARMLFSRLPNSSTFKERG